MNYEKFGQKSLAKTSHSNNSFTTLNAGVKSCGIHLYMINWHRSEDETSIAKEISMHLSLEETEDLIKGLKHRLELCYESKVREL
jgi:hypothetical protein